MAVGVIADVLAKIADPNFRRKTRAKLRMAALMAETDAKNALNKLLESILKGK